MVLGTLSRQAIRQIPKVKNELERLYAVAAGTAAGVGATPGVKAFYKEWITKQDWKNPYKTKRAKGDVLVDETSNTQQEALHPGDPFFGSKRHIYEYNFGFSNRRGRKFARARKRRCACKSYLR